MKPIEPFLAEKQLREIYPVSRREVNRWCKEGCPSRLIGRRRYYRPYAVERWLKYYQGKDEGNWLEEE